MGVSPVLRRKGAQALDDCGEKARWLATRPVRGESSGVVPASIRVDQQELGRRRSLQPESLSLAGRRPANPYNDVWSVGLRKDRVAQKEFGVRDHGCTRTRSGSSPAAKPRSRLRQERPPRNCRKGSDGFTKRGVRIVARTAGDDALRSIAHQRLKSFDEIRTRGFRNSPLEFDGGAGGNIERNTSRVERLTQWPVQMDGTARTRAGLQNTARGNAARERGSWPSCFGHGQLVEPAHVGAVDLDLIDRLPRPAIAQLRGAVGAQHQQRHAGMIRLNYCGQVIRCSCTRCAHQRHGRPKRFGHTEREKARRALIKMNRDIEILSRPGNSGRRKTQRCRARSRRDANVANTRMGELVEERESKLISRCAPGF